MLPRLPVLCFLSAVSMILTTGCTSKPGYTVSMPAFQETLVPFMGVDLPCLRLVAGGQTLTLPADGSLTLRLEPEAGDTLKVSGRAAVNRFFGRLTLTAPGQITWSPLGSTRMAGPPERMQLESRFLGALPETQRLSTTAHGLLFQSEDGKNVVEFGR